MKNENFSYHVIGTPGTKDAENYNSGQLDAENERRAGNTVKDEAGNDVPQPLEALVPARTQAFGIKEFESVEEFATHPAPDSVKLDIINRAARLKQQVAAKRLIENPEWPLVDGVFDMEFAISQEVEKRKMSDEDKAIKALDKLSPEIRAQLLQSLLAAQAAQKTAPSR